MLEEELRTKMIANAAEINRLHGRIHETVKRRAESEQAREAWSRACAEFHARYGELWLPGGPYPNFYERLLAGDTETIEVALCFLEVRPYFFRSGYHWKTILQKCRKAPMSGRQAERFARLLQTYLEWRKARNLSSQRGAAVRRDLVSLLLRFYKLFPVKLADSKFDGLVTVGDLYNLLCNALKIDPVQPREGVGTVREPYEMALGAGVSAWAKEYSAWRDRSWAAEDVWATLVSTIRDAYQIDPSAVIGPETILRDPAKGHPQA